MKVILKRSCLVQPTEPTWKGRMPLTESDQTGEITHTTIIYFYKNCPITPKTDTNFFTTLKTSLSKVLVHFYPLAGRLRWLDGSRLELDCNGNGALIVEASCDVELDDLGDFTPTPDFNYLIPHINYKESPIEEIPLFAAQLTKFSCGGLTLSCSISHAVADGQSGYHFMSEWARLARGEPLGSAPFLNRKVLRAGDPPHLPLPLPLPLSLPQPQLHNQYASPRPQLIAQPSSAKSRMETTITLLKLSKFQVEMLRNEANNNSNTTRIGRAYTRYESVAGHIWRTACRSRRHAGEQPTQMGVYVNIRQRMQPPLPENYFGNAVEYAIASSLLGDLVKRPLGFAAGRIREAIDRVTNEYVHSGIDFSKKLKDLSGLQNTHEGSSRFNGNLKLEVTSWIGFPIYGMDFGWGKEIFMAPAMLNYDDGDSYILPGYAGDGSLVVALCLQSAYMEDFKKMFYQIYSNL